VNGLLVLGGLGGFMFVFARGPSCLTNNPVTDEQLAAAADWQKRGQFLIDYVFSENSSGIHAPQETGRLLVTAMDHIRSGEIALRR